MVQYFDQEIDKDKFKYYRDREVSQIDNVYVSSKKDDKDV